MEPFCPCVLQVLQSSNSVCLLQPVAIAKLILPALE